MAVTLVVEDGTGLSTANVYDDEVVTETYLTDEEGLTAFSRLATADIKKRTVLRMTRFVERPIATRVDGARRQQAQGLIFPRLNATDWRGDVFDDDVRPTDYRNGIMLMCEQEAQALFQGRRVTHNDPRNQFFQVRDGKGILQRNRPQILAWYDRFPDEWDLIRTAFPPGLRNLRA